MAAMQTDAPSTDLWVERCRSGDPVAWRHLYDEHFPMVFRLAIRLGASEREAADISQEVFLRAWKGLHTFRGEAQFRTWLYRITFNETSRFAKKAGLRRKLSAVLQLFGAEPAPPAPGPDRQAERSEAFAHLQLILGRLKPKQRSVFVLYEIEELSLEEIADLLGCPLETVRSRLRLARADFDRLRRHPGLAASAATTGFRP